MSVTRGSSAKQRAKQIRIAERTDKALALAEQGKSSREIALVFGVSRVTIDNDFKRALEDYHAQRIALAELVFDDQLRACDQQLAQLAPRRQRDDGSLDLNVIREYRAWLQERARLLGLYPRQDNDADRTPAAIVQNYYIDFGASTDRPNPPRQDDVVDGHAHAVHADPPLLSLGSLDHDTEAASPDDTDQDNDAEIL